MGRIELPRYRDQPDDAPSIGQYRNAFLLGDDLATGPPAVVLGTTPDGQAVVHEMWSPQPA